MGPTSDSPREAPSASAHFRGCSIARGRMAERGLSPEASTEAQGAGPTRPTHIGFAFRIAPPVELRTTGPAARTAVRPHVVSTVRGANGDSPSGLLLIWVPIAVYIKNRQCRCGLFAPLAQRLSLASCAFWHRCSGLADAPDPMHQLVGIVQ